MASSKTPINGGFNGKIVYTWGISQLAVLKLPEDLSESLEYESAIWFSHFHGFQVYISCKFGMGVMSYESSSYCHHSLGIRAVSSSHPGWQAWSSMLCFRTLQELNLLTCFYIYIYTRFICIYIYIHIPGRKKKPIRSFSRATRGCLLSFIGHATSQPVITKTTARLNHLSVSGADDGIIYIMYIYIYTHRHVFWYDMALCVFSVSPCRFFF